MSTASSHQHQPLTPANPSWIWSGVHGASGIVHPFLAIRDDPDGRYSGLGLQFDHINTILDGSGGLLLIKQSPPDLEAFDEEASDKFHGMLEVLRGMGLLVAEPGDQEIDTPDLDALGKEGTDTLRRILGLFQSIGLLAAEEDDQSNNTPEVAHDQASLELDQHWQTLMVVNPSTHESRVLPPANSTDVGLEFWSYNGVQANLLVDKESQTYTVTLTFPDCVCLYSSTSNAWQCQRFIQGASWRSHNRELPEIPWLMSVANTYVNGRLFFADVVVDDSVPIMKLIEIDAQAGSWRLHNWRYSLRTQFAESTDTAFLRMRGLIDHGMHHAQTLDTQTLASHRRGRALENFQIVECMGELYAVIPMSLEEYLPMSLQSRSTFTEAVHEYANLDMSFMPLQFMIVNLHGDGFVHGVLRILVPEDIDVSIIVGSEEDSSNEDRKNILTEMMALEPADEFKWRFNCVAEGSVIWVALLDYVLQYDVVTGVSKTEIIGASSPELALHIQEDTIPYRPSDMKP